MKEYGQLTLQLQPGSRFTERRAGFDDGTRTFVCDTADVDRLKPKLESRDSTYKRMYVESVDVENMTVQLSRVTVRYMGLMSRKGVKVPNYELKRNTQQISEVPTFGGFAILTPVRFERVLPVVIVIYVTGEMPNEADVGTEKDPPKYAAVPSTFYGDKFRTGVTTLFKGWRLSDRAMRTSGPYFEVTDTYTYTINEGRIEVS